jgi:hypothetical protein
VDAAEGIVTAPPIRAVGVSADGSYVTGHSVQTPTQSPQPVLWNVHGETLRTLGTDGSATAVSADGRTVFGYGGGAAIRWTLSDSAVTPQVLRPGTAFMNDATPDGKAAVGHTRFEGATGPSAFRWDQARGAVNLGLLTGYNYSWPYSISADGTTAAGYLHDGGIAGNEEAFRWTQSGGMAGLGDFPGGVFYSAATDVSADGSLVVGWGNTPDGVEYFVWDQVRGMRSLRDVLMSEFGLGEELAGWRLTAPSVLPGFGQAHHVLISDDGRVLAGTGLNPLGQKEAWVVTLPTAIPEPTLLGVLPCAAALALRRARRAGRRD